LASHSKSVEDISVESQSEDAGRKATLKLFMRWSREAAGKEDHRAQAEGRPLGSADAIRQGETGRNLGRNIGKNLRNALKKPETIKCTLRKMNACFLGPAEAQPQP